MKEYKRDRLISLVFIIIGLSSIYFSTKFNGDSAVFPIFMSSLIILMGILLIIFSKKITVYYKCNDNIIWSRFSISLILSLLFYSTIESIGLYVVMPIFIFATCILLGKVKLLASFTISIFFSFGLFIVFEKLLEVPTPAGLLETFLRG